MCNVWHKLKDSSINRINSGKKKKRDNTDLQLTGTWGLSDRNLKIMMLNIFMKKMIRWIILPEKLNRK